MAVATTCSIDDFRTAMRRVAATVNLLTTLHEGRRWGLTATAVCSLTADPPMVLACVNRDAEAYEALIRSRRVAINVLRDSQASLASHFSGTGGARGEQKFAEGRWGALATGAPVLLDASLCLDCRIERFVESGSHSVMMCAVQSVALGDDGDPLLYMDRRFFGLSPVTA